MTISQPAGLGFSDIFKPSSNEWKFPDKYKKQWHDLPEFVSDAAIFSSHSCGNVFCRRECVCVSCIVYLASIFLYYFFIICIVCHCYCHHQFCAWHEAKLFHWASIKRKMMPEFFRSSVQPTNIHRAGWAMTMRAIVPAKYYNNFLPYGRFSLRCRPMSTVIAITIAN